MGADAKETAVFDSRTTTALSDEGLSKAGAAPSLAILIPTYNGTHFLRRAIIAHGEIIKAANLPVDIVVSDNCSMDATGDVVRSLMSSYKMLKYVRQTGFLDTAEGHLFQACSSVNYDYLWIFGDDDLPCPGGLEHILDLVKLNRFGAIFTNMRSFSAETGIVDRGRTADAGLVGSQLDYEGNVQDIISRIGFQTVTACFSIAVVKRELLTAAPFEAYMKASPIYSHVAVYLHAFFNSDCYFLGYPAIDYRTGATTEDNWTSFATRRKQSFHTPWTFGLLRLIRKLGEEGRIKPNFLFEVHEHTASHVFFLWVHVIEKILLDLEHVALMKANAYLATEEDFEAFAAEFSRSSDPLPLELAARTLKIARQLRLLEADGGLASSPALRGVVGGQMADLIRRHACEQIDAVRSRLFAPTDGPVEWPRPPLPTYIWGEDILLGNHDADKHLVKGFSNPEPWGRWTDGRVALVQVRHSRVERDVVLVMRVCQYWKPNDQECRVDISINDALLASRVICSNEPILQIIPNDILRSDGRLDITLQIANPKTRMEQPTSDTRMLGLGLIAINLSLCEEC